MTRPVLNQRQTQCLRLAAYGITNEAIGRRLDVTTATVANDLFAARRTLRARNTAHAVGLAVVHGIVTAEHLGLSTQEGA